MKMPNFSKMTVDALIAAKKTIDGLITKKAGAARKELEERLSVINSYFDGGGKRRGRKPGSRGRKGTVAPKYRGPNGETWAGRGLRPRWLTAAMKGGAKLEDFAIGAGGRRKAAKKTKAKRGAAKRKTGRPAKRVAARAMRRSKATQPEQQTAAS